MREVLWSDFSVGLLGQKKWDKFLVNAELQWVQSKNYGWQEDNASNLYGLINLLYFLNDRMSKRIIISFGWMVIVLSSFAQDVSSDIVLMDYQRLAQLKDSSNLPSRSFLMRSSSQFWDAVFEKRIVKEGP